MDKNPFPFTACAVCVIGNTIESVNIPFILASRRPSKAGIRAFAKKVVEYYPYLSLESLLKYMDNFLFYFNLECDNVL